MDPGILGIFGGLNEPIEPHRGKCGASVYTSRASASVLGRNFLLCMVRQQVPKLPLAAEKQYCKNIFEVFLLKKWSSRSFICQGLFKSLC